MAEVKTTKGTAQSAPILQANIPFDIGPRPLPGIQPLAPDDWLAVDDAFAGQTTLRRHLIEARRADVIALDPSAKPAADELLEMTLDLLSRRPDRGYEIESVMRSSRQERRS